MQSAHHRSWKAYVSSPLEKEKCLTKKLSTDSAFKNFIQKNLRYFFYI
jgi:hypothetical protein